MYYVYKYQENRCNVLEMRVQIDVDTYNLKQLSEFESISQLG